MNDGGFLRSASKPHLLFIIIIDILITSPTTNVMAPFFKRRKLRVQDPYPPF